MKDKECIMCKHLFTCKGKPTEAPCVNFEERKKKDGRCKVDQDGHKSV